MITHYIYFEKFPEILEVSSILYDKEKADRVTIII